MESIKESYISLEKKINDVITDFYEQNPKSGFSKLDLVIEKILLLINQIRQENENTYKENERELNDLFQEIMAALGNKDVILISDLLKYELLNKFKVYIS